MAEAATVRKLLKQLSNSGTAIEAAAQLDDFITSDGKLPVLVANAKIAISVGLFTGLKEVFKQKHVELPLLESLANLVWNLGIDKGIRQMALTGEGTRILFFNHPPSASLCILVCVTIQNCRWSLWRHHLCTQRL
eukprot:m.242294 g.242294  ORF g.242294 m.242294 type:complete len:135 (-) comp54439_c0_seq2:2136-2540(-)